MSDPVSVLVVAHQTAANSALLEAVHERAQQGPVRFHMVVPSPAARDAQGRGPERSRRARSQLGAGGRAAQALARGGPGGDRQRGGSRAAHGHP